MMREHRTGPRRGALRASLEFVLRLYSPEFRREYGEEWLEAAVRRIRDVGSAPSRRLRLTMIVGLIADTVVAASRTRLSKAPGRATIDRSTSLGFHMEHLLKDVRFGFRSMIRRPLFACVSVGTLALGIGATTAVFSVVEGVLLRPLPYENPHELVQILETFPEWRNDPQLSADWDQVYLAWPDYRRLRDGTTQLRDVAIYGTTRRTLTGAGDPERLVVGLASSTLLSTLGVSPALGRFFLPGEDGPGAPRLAVLAHSFWTERFDGDRSAIGRSITLSDEPFTIVGVLPEGFTVRGFGVFPGAGDPPVWVPIGAHGGRMTAGSHNYDAVARLAEGRTIAEAFSETEGLLRGDRPSTELGARLVPRVEMEASGLRRPLYTLLGASFLLLVIAVVNVAMILLGEVTRRRSEMRARAALGAGRARLIRQLIVEGVVLGVLGSAGGILIAALGTRSLVALAPPLPRLETVGVNPSVFLFAAAVGVAAGIIFGLAPALELSWGNLKPGHRGGGRAVGGKRATGLRRAVVAVQVALTVVLLVSGGLLARTLQRMLVADPGFERDNLVALTLRLPSQSYVDAQARLAATDRIREAMSGVPGVAAVTGTSSLPFAGFPNLISFGIDGRPQAEDEGSPHVSTRTVMPGYFETMGISLITGRTLTRADREGRQRVAVIGAEMARRFWPDGGALGARVLLRDTLTVVGIVGDVRHEAMDAEILPTLYVPLAQQPQLGLTFIARTTDDSSALFGRLRSAVWSVESSTTISRTVTLHRLVSNAAREDRFRAVLMVVLALGATLLAGVGVFGVTARGVSQRSREMGVRRALGAERSELVRLALGETIASGLVGAVVGFVGALWATRLLQDYLFQVARWDPTIYGCVALLLILVSGLGGYFPARRAWQVEPVDVLRSE